MLHVSTHIESSSGPQGVGPDIQTYTALWDPQLRWGSHNAVCLDLHLEDLKMTRCESKHVAHIVIITF